MFYLQQFYTYTGFFEQFQTVFDAIGLTVDDSFYAGLDNEFGTFKAR
jgi:hypothetical protein